MPSVSLSTGGFLYGPDPDTDHGFDARLAPRPVADLGRRHRLDLSGHDKVDPGKLLEPVETLIGEADMWCSRLKPLAQASSLRDDMKRASKIWRGWSRQLERYAETHKAYPVSGTITHLLGEDFRRFGALVDASRAAVARSASSTTSLASRPYESGGYESAQAEMERRSTDQFLTAKSFLSRTQIAGPPARSPFSLPSASGPHHDPERPFPRS
ncbi:hypothetical protein [Roseateles sp.]|uniref:hypothetical protein n=1 Tax=Roseateles sp. TaxID=1971397 RepID=UPI0031D04192